MKAAICSSDGIQVDLHFGKTSLFFIYEINQDQKKLIEKRGVNPLSPTEEFLADREETHELELDRFNDILYELRDVDRIYTASIGSVPKQKLTEAGIKVVICNCPMENIPVCDGKCK